MKNDKEALKERAWKLEVPKDLAKRFAGIVNSDNPDFEEAREVIKDILNFVKDKVGEDFYEDDLIEDLDWADFDSEEDVDYYINEMYDVLDGYGVWMTPASSFDESKKSNKEAKIKEGNYEDYLQQSPKDIYDMVCRVLTDYENNGGEETGGEVISAEDFNEIFYDALYEVQKYLSEALF